MQKQNDFSRHLDDLADKLIEKQQKFTYFFITANTGVVIYSTSFFLDKTKINIPLSGKIFWFLLVGCLSLLFSTSFCICFLFFKNKAYELYIDALPKPNSKLFKVPPFYKKAISFTLYAMFISFFIGMSSNIFAYISYFYRIHR